MGRDNVVPPHYRSPRTQGGGHAAAAHTPTSPRQIVSTQASKQAGARGGGTQKRPTTPPKRQHQKRKHQKANTTQTQTPNPSHPQANTPTTSPSCHPHANTNSAHATARGQAKCVSTGTRGSKGRPARTKRRHTTRARRQRTQKAQTTRFARSVRLRPQRGTAREKAAHNSPRQSAWVVVFVGVFADVCRRFWAGWFGGLGVFWGCLACFLVF